MKVFTDDGAWCWFQDPRALYVKGRRERTYAQWITRDGTLQAGAYDHADGSIEVTTLKTGWGRDDHNVGSFVVLPDKRLMVFYAQHNGKGLYCRTAREPESIRDWGDEVAISETGRITYSHPLYLRAEGRLYVFWRGPTWKPTVATSRDGVSWSEPRVLIQAPGKEGRSVRPYTKITSDGETTIHITFTDGHPRVEPQNSVYYLRYANGTFEKADGTSVGAWTDLPVSHRSCDVVYDGDAVGGRAWVWDIAVDRNNFPVIAYTRLPEATDHRYCVARWDGERWLDRQVTPGGPWFPETPEGKEEREPHYSGGMALHPADPAVLYVSRQIGDTFEIEKWTASGADSWTATPVTTGSSAMNVRPVVPRGCPAGWDHLLWMQGSYEHYTRYGTGIRMLMPSP